MDILHTTQDPARSSWPLIGRDDAIEHVRRLLDAPRCGGLTVALLRGPAGSGRSRLIRACLDIADDSGWATHRATGTRAGRTIPFAALADLLPPDAEHPLQLFRRTAAHLHSMADDRTVLIGVDDAHLLDRQSAALLHHLAVAGSIAIVAGVTDDAAVPDALQTLVADEATLTIVCAPLTAAQITTLLEQVLGGEVDAGAAQRLRTLSEGRPRALREVVEAALAGGTLVCDHGRWGLGGPVVGDRALPPTMTQRLGRLDPDDLTVVEVVALAEPISVTTLEEVVGPALDAAEATGLLTLVNDGDRQQVAIADRFLAEGIRARTPQLRRRRITRELAAAVVATGARRDCDTRRLAEWRLESGDQADPDLFMKAALLAMERGDYHQTERMAGAASKLGGRFEARLLHAGAVCALGQVERAARLLRALQADADDDGQMAETVAARAFLLLQGGGHAREADRFLELARRTVADGPRRDELTLARASLAMNLGRFATAVPALVSVSRRPETTPGNQLGAAVIGVSSLAIAGRPCEALELCDQALDAQPADAAPHSHVVHLLDLGRCLALAFAGRLDDAHRIASEHYRSTLDAQLDNLRGQWALPLGNLALLAGRVETAASRLREADALIGQHVTELSRFPHAYGLGSLAEAAALAGDGDAARRALARARAATPSAYVPTVDRGETWLAVAQGELSRARDHAADAADRAAEHGALAFQALALHDLARLGDSSRVGQRLDRLVERLDGDLWPILAQHTGALASSDPARIADCAARLAELGFFLLAAEAGVQATALYRRSGLGGSALAEQRRTQTWLERCENARTPALSAAATGPSIPELTAREHEIAGLAARGLTNRGIAELLFVSPRTVANHLYRIYAKLEIPGRETLAQMLG